MQLAPGLVAQTDVFLIQRSLLSGEALPALQVNGLSNRIRCLFETATATEHGAHCPLLWRMYLNFMVKVINTLQFRNVQKYPAINCLMPFVFSTGM